jgi:N-acylneuraminate cytidylyltransferase
MKIAVIPARFGSKRIKKKNIKIFFSKPMIVWVIEKLKKNNFFDKIVVSSDSDDILNVVKKTKCIFAIKRPKSLSGDHIGVQPVIKHAISKIKKNNSNFQYICCIYPCNPFLDIDDLKKSFKRFKNNKEKFLFSIAEYSHPIQRAIKLKKDFSTSSYFRGSFNKRTQDLKKSYYDAGQFCWGTTKLWEGKKNIHNLGVGFKVPFWRVVDIDTFHDWKRAELLFKILNNKSFKIKKHD